MNKNDSMKISDFDSLYDISEFAKAAAQDFIEKRMKKMTAREIGFEDSRAGYQLYVSGEGIVVHKDGLRDLRYYGGFEYISEENVSVVGDYTMYSVEDDRVERLIQRLFDRGVDLE